MANSKSLIIEPQQVVSAAGINYEITHLIDVDQVLAKNLENQKFEQLDVADLQPAVSLKQAAPPENNRELTLINEDDWAEARRRFEVIRPLLNNEHRRTTAQVKSIVNEYKIHKATIYRWIRLYEETGTVSALLPQKSGFPNKKSRLTPEVETIVQTAIETIYLKKQRRSVRATYQEVERLCRAAQLKAPIELTVRNKIAQIQNKEKTAKRFSPKRAREEFDPIQGEFPHADYPLAVVQIDHTKLDIMIVDETFRQSIGRPWITVAIDVFSRMVMGFSVSLDSPANLSVGLCLSHAILPKETWLAKTGVEGSWSCWGFPKTIHADNAKEFRGTMLRRACEEYGINLEWRPIGRPHYGGHIERLMGTFGTEIHDLPGTTFSNPQERKEYDSEKEAVMTLCELEKWLATFIVGVYHERFHEGTNTTPLEKWRTGILGTDERPGTGLPPRVIDAEKLRLDFLPAISRTIQQYGVQLDEVYYNHDILKRYVNAKDEKNPKLKRSFVFKRDPRDISEIYFYDPELKQHFTIPYRDTSRPAMSLWDLREIKDELKKQGRSKVNETMIFETREKLREQEEQATTLTKSTRRKRERRILHQAGKPSFDKEKTATAEDINQQPKKPDLTQIARRIRPFDELEEIE